MSSVQKSKLGEKPATSRQTSSRKPRSSAPRRVKDSKPSDVIRDAESVEVEEELNLGTIITKTTKTRNTKKRRNTKADTESVTILSEAGESSQPPVVPTEAPESEANREAEADPVVLQSNPTANSVKPIEEPTVSRDKTETPVRETKNLKLTDKKAKNSKPAKKVTKRSTAKKPVIEEVSHEDEEEEDDDDDDDEDDDDDDDEDEDGEDDGEEDGEEEEVPTPSKNKRNTRYDPLPTSMSKDPLIRKRQCTTCFRICSAPDKLRRHALTHKNVAQSICPNCNKTIKFSYNLKTHLESCTRTTWEDDLEVLWKMYPDWMTEMYKARENPALPMPPLPSACTLQKDGIVTGYDPRFHEVQAEVAREKSERQNMGKQKLQYEAPAASKRGRKRITDTNFRAGEDMAGTSNGANNDDSASDDEPFAV